MGFFDWVLKYCTVFTGMYEMSNRKYYEIQGNTMKYLEILENSKKNPKISGNTRPKT
jgi:hypothetical protein